MTKYRVIIVESVDKTRGTLPDNLFQDVAEFGLKHRIKCIPCRGKDSRCVYHLFITPIEVVDKFTEIVDRTRPKRLLLCETMANGRKGALELVKQLGVNQ